MNINSAQIKAILWKNFLVNFRTKQFIREIISVLIIGVFIIIIQNNTPNSFITPFYLSLAIIGYGRSVGYAWVLQKQTYQKEMQNIMGVSFASYTISWIIYFILNAIYVWAIMMGLLFFGIFLKNEQVNFKQGYGVGELSLLYFIYSLSTISFVLFLSSFFTKAKVAAQALVFSQLILNFLYFVRFTQSYRNSRAFLLLSGIFPQIAFNYGICDIAFINKDLPLTMDYYYIDSLVSLLISIFFYTTLAFYLQQVLPNSQGTNKSPLFFLKNCFKKFQNSSSISEPLLSESSDQSNGQYQHRNISQEPIIKMFEVSKKFGDLVAVNKLTVNFYGNQIYCLLGHNGAGKSTTINLLTGLQKPTSGNIQLMRLNYKEDIDEIRKNIGLCLQFNVLYEDLKIQEHLKFYALLKNYNASSIQQNIEKTINQCSLAMEKGKFVKNLSGGNKRKLSLANSLIGESKIIFLDQPSSGLDPNSRQGVWSIIKSVRTPQRCLILTTHHLEQAQQLAQIIGIMSEGKMVMFGSNDFIKQKSNVGFHVQLQFKEGEQQMMHECQQIIKNQILNAKRDNQTAVNTLKFIFPNQQIKKFASIFKRLQKLCKLSVKLSNLEDSFIKLGQLSANQQEEINENTLQLPNFTCSYSFLRQFKAIFYRKLISTTRSLSVVVSILLPVFFILLGVLMSCLVIQGNTPFEEWIRRYLMAFFMVWAFIFNTSTFCGDLVLQREKRFKYLSHVLGLRKIPYWAANYTFDLLIFLIPLSIFFIVIFSTGEKGKFLTDVASYLVVIFFLFAFSFIGYSYLFSFMFQKSSTAFRLFPFFNLIFFFIIPTIPLNVDPEGNLAQYICPMISPFVAFFYCFFTKEIMGNQIIQNFLSKSLLYNYLCLIIQAITYLAIALYIENARFRLRDRQHISQEDEVREDEEMLLSGIQPAIQTDEIVIKNLYKKYSNGYLAIKDNSFSVRKGQIFGLLGPNGAGKSTTFNIVTAALSKTSGIVNILGEDINNGIMDIFSEFGVCPQTDAIYENLTTQEHLKYAARIKGVPQSQISILIKYYYDLLSLNSYVNTNAGNLSGGNKRKLAVSMSMMANPKIMFFDEPSSGVDPISRRFLWKSLNLSSRTKQAAMVLTTHTMSQAQSLCSRIGILIKGKFITIASPGQLKAKYGKGFRIEVLYELQFESEIIHNVKQLFGENLQIEKLQKQTMIFTVDNTIFSYSKAYELFENVLSQKKIVKKYKIKESTLECNLRQSKFNIKSLGNSAAGNWVEMGVNGFDFRRFTDEGFQATFQTNY